MVQFGQIIADHTVVDKFDDIPQYYINEVKKMWLVVAGESHSAAYRAGLLALEAAYPAYLVSVVEEGTPEAYTTSNLRTSRATWGDVDNSSGWIYDYGEEDWYTSPTAISRTKAGITYCNTHNLTIGAMGFGWCYDETILDMTDYLTATQSYIDYCTTNGYSTKVFFTTGPVDGFLSYGVNGYNNYLRYEDIRDYVDAHTTAILFDYADILCYNNSGELSTAWYEGHTYPVIHDDNYEGDPTGHIGMVGAIRLAKAMWWMLARIAGWDGGTSNIDESNISVDLFKLVKVPGEIYLQFINPGQEGIAKIYSLQGSLIKSSQIRNDVCTFSTTSFAPGTYIVALQTIDGVQSKKFVLP